MSFRRLFARSAVAVLAALILSAGAAVEARQRGRSRTPKVQSATVALTENGYEPASLRLRKGVPARVTFIRRVSAGCGQEITLPDYGISRELPLNEAVTVEFTPAKAGEFTFSCAMGMLRGTLVVR